MLALATQLQAQAIPKITAEQRHAESPLATPAYRKDIYNILHKMPRQSLLTNGDIEQNKKIILYSRIIHVRDLDLDLNHLVKHRLIYLEY